MSGTTYYIAPDGRDNAAGTEAEPWSFKRLMAHVPEPGNAYWLRGGTYEGNLEWFGVGDPDRPIRLASYGGAAVINSGANRGLWYAGPGGLLLENLKFAGTHAAGVEINGDPDRREARNIRLVMVEASGYTSDSPNDAAGGLVISTGSPISDIFISNCNFHRNANGIFVSGDVGRRCMVRNLRIVSTLANDNTLPNPASCGNGMSLVGVEGLEVRASEFWGNGRLDGQGHSGLTVQQCRDFLVIGCQGGGTLPGPDGDGQCIVSNDSENGVIEGNTIEGGYIGIAVHDDRQYHPGFPSRNVIVQRNTIRGTVVGLQVFRTYGNVWLLDNELTVHSAAGEYRKALDFYGPHDGPVYVDRNTIRATEELTGLALLLEAAEEQGLRNVTLGPQNAWQATRKIFSVKNEWYPSLPTALGVTPVEVS